MPVTFKRIISDVYERKGRLSQHFLLSAKARTLSVVEVARMSDDEAYAAFRAVRFADNGGEPFCPHCGCDAVYEYRVRRLFKCKACERQFTVTSGTTFRSRKMSFQDILAAILLFANGVNGHAALRLSRDLNCSYKTAFVLLHKLRRAMGAMQAQHTLTGVVEVDGVFIGGYVRPANMKADRPDTRKEYNRKRRVIVTMRERRIGGRSRSVVVKDEKAAVPAIRALVHPDAHVMTDDQSAFGKFYVHFADHSAVNHTKGHSIQGVHINGVEAQHSRIRRSERGVYLQLNGAHAERYAAELSWRDDHRRVSNGQQYRAVLAAATTSRPDAELVGYWEKRPAWLLHVGQRRELKALTRRKRARQGVAKLARERTTGSADRHH